MSCDLNTEALGGCVLNCAKHDMKHRCMSAVADSDPTLSRIKIYSTVTR